MTNWSEPSKRKHLNSEGKRNILEAALKLAEREGLTALSRSRIARAANCSDANVSYHYATMAQLNRAVMRHAIARACLKVIAEGIASKNPHALKAPPALKAKAIATLAA